MSLGHQSQIENSRATQTIVAATYNDASADGTTVALAGSSAGQFRITNGAWTDGTHVITFEHSEDDTTWVTIPKTDLTGYDIDNVQRLDVAGNTYTIGDATKDGDVTLVAYFGGFSYLRCSRTGGGVTGALYSVSVEEIGLRYSGRNPMGAGWDTANVPE